MNTVRGSDSSRSTLGLLLVVPGLAGLSIAWLAHDLARIWVERLFTASGIVAAAGLVLGLSTRRSRAGQVTIVLSTVTLIGVLMRLLDKG
jgi:hypothetical protein